MERAATRERNEGRLSEAPEGTAATQRRRSANNGGDMARLTGLGVAAAIVGLTAVQTSAQAVSYTHLTLPTIYSV